MGELEQILEEIREKSKDMVTFDRPHKYYEAIETTIAEKIIRRHLETEKEFENKILEAVRGLIRSAEDIIELPVLGECDKTYGEVFHQFLELTGIPRDRILDYRPAAEIYCGYDIPGAIVVWIKDGGEIIFRPKED